MRAFKTTLKNKFPKLFKIYQKFDAKLSAFLHNPKKMSKLIQSSYPQILSYQETIEKLQQGASISRLGDGEFKLILGKSIYFQNKNQELKKRLVEILNRPSTDKLLIAIPQCHAGLNFISKPIENYSYVDRFWLKYYRKISKYFTQKQYANANISRTEAFSVVSLSDFRSIWNKRKVVFVVPQDGHFVFDKRIFGNIKRPRYIYCPKDCAFDAYKTIYDKCIAFNKDVLFIICAGPTATVLAADLSDLGYQALDLGHLANCYRYYLKETDIPEKEFKWKA
ncbi:MAG: GT-D fold domain-containing glycosyltransferase [Bacilli bacterium]|nr:GT-D fold domain-containing glycosyltransferase [Bacilli bacterium]